MLARKAQSTRNVTIGMDLRLVLQSMKMVGLTLLLPLEPIFESAIILDPSFFTINSFGAIFLESLLSSWNADDDAVDKDDKDDQNDDDPVDWDGQRTEGH